MMRENAEKWRELAEQAVHEQDPDRLLELVRELNRLLDQKMHRLKDSQKTE